MFKKITGIGVFLALIVILLFSCDIPTGEKPVCRHNAIYSAITYSDLTKRSVGIAVGFTDSKDRHAQAFSISSIGKIQWLKLMGGKIIIDKMDNFYPYTFINVDEFEERYVQVKKFNKSKLDILLKQMCSKRTKE